MTRAQQEAFKATGAGGINQQVELADPSLQLADALNVWAPNGRIEVRPGFTGYGRVGPVLASAGGETEYFVTEVGYTPSSSGTFVEPSLGSAFPASHLTARDSDGEGSRFLIGLDEAATVEDSLRISLWLDGGVPSTSDTTIKVEYWNGSAWRAIPSTLVTSGYTREYTFLTNVFVQYLEINPPRDWAKTAIATDVTVRYGYWLRITLLDEDLTTGTELDSISWLTMSDQKDSNCFIYPVQFLSNRRYVIAARTQSVVAVINQVSKFRESGSGESITISAGASIEERPTIAEVPSFNEAFICSAEFQRRVTDDGTIDEAFDETTDAFLQEFRDAGIALTKAPKAKYTVFFDGRLWFAGIEGEPYTVRWSAAQPYHRIFPGLSFEYLMENDKSPITGLSTLGEYLVVFKQDSIWVMARGAEVGGLQTYQPIPVVTGKGCVANSTIQAVRNNLVFLSEDGFYAFDGSSELKKLSDPVSEYVETIRQSTVGLAASVNWSTKSLYMCSVKTSYRPSARTSSGVQGHLNDTTFVYDYKNGTWWIWRGFEPTCWMLDEDASDLQTLWFTDCFSRLYRFDHGRTDYGEAISWNFTTHRFGYYDDVVRRLRKVRLIGNNLAREIDVLPLPNDAIKGTTGTIDFTDENEVEYGDAVTEGVDYVVPRRRTRRIDYRVNNDWIQLKVSGDTKNARAEIALIDIGQVQVGVR
jgi:hypothetical protein